jgi:hypothetical protein
MDGSSVMDELLRAQLSPLQNPSDVASPASPAFSSSSVGRPESWSLVSYGFSSSGSRKNLREDVRGLAVIRPECELVQVERKVRLGDVVEASHNASFQERPEAIDTRRVNFTPDVFAARMANGLVPEIAINRGVPPKLVRGDERNGRRNRLVNEIGKGLRIGSLDDLGDDVSFSGDRPNNRHLPGSSCPALSPLCPASDPSAVAVLRLPADVGFVNLNHPGQLLEFVVLHRAADAVAHIPSRPIGTAADGAVDLESADSLLRLAHQVDHLKPRFQGVIGVLEDRSDERGEPIPVFRALLALPCPRAGQLVNFRASAARAFDPVGPPEFDEVRPALVFRGEAVVQFRQRHNEEHYTYSGVVSSAA